MRLRFRIGLQQLAVIGLLGAAQGNAQTVTAWGSNAQGQTNVPAGLMGVTAIAGGFLHSLALKSDGTVVAWGDNTLGQTNVPAGLTGVTAIATGSNHSLALKSDGTVVAWGFNGYGQTTVPAGLTGVTAIAAGDIHSFALKSDGTVVAWGYNNDGETTVPAGLTGVTAIAGGAIHSLSLKSDGTVVAWGANNFGQTNVPAGLTGVTAIAGGRYHSLALKSDGTVVAWGANNLGQTNVPAGLTGVTAIAGGLYHSLALKSDGTVVAWGNNNEGETNVPAGLTGVTAIAGGFNHSLALQGGERGLGWGRNLFGETTVPAGLTGLTAIAGGGAHSLALKSDGTVVAWGLNDNGQTNVPAGLTGVTAIAAGAIHSLALKSDGTVVAWGDNTYGQTHVPAGLTGVTAIAAGSNHSLALKSDGTVVAWGYNNLGQTNVPAGLTGVTAIAAGDLHSLALKSNGTVVAWGDNTLGQTNVPAGLTGVTAIASGRDHSLALKSDGTVVAWGDNTYGQTHVPAGLTGVTAIAAGSNHSLALKSDGTVVAWGLNNFGQTNVPAGLTGVTAIAAGFFHSLALTTAPLLSLAQTITFNTLPDVTYGIAPFSLTASASSTLPVTYTGGVANVCSVTSAGSVTILGVGQCSVTANQTGNVVYAAATSVTQTFMVNKIAQNITFNAPAAHTYGDPPFNVTATASSGLTVTFSGGTSGVCSVTTAGVVTIIGGGTCSLTANQPGDTHYGAATSVTQTFTVNPKAQTITFTAPPAHTYGDAPFTVTASSDSLLAVTFSGGTSGVCSVTSAGVVTILGGGTCSLTANQPGDTHYAAATSVTQTFTVNLKTQTITFTAPPAHTYGDAPFTATASSDSLLAVTFSGGTSGVCSVTTAGVVTIIGGGTCSLTANQPGDTHYAAATSVTQMFTVNPKAQTINFANPGTQAYGAVVNLSASATSGLTVTFTSLTPAICTVSGTQATMAGSGQCSIQATQPGNANYAAAAAVTQNFSVVVSDLTIQKTHVGHFSQGQTDAMYTITVSNVGSAATNGSAVTVTDRLPISMTTVAMSGVGWNCSAATLNCSRSDVLSNGFSYPPITLTVRVSAAAPASVNNLAAVSGGGEINTSNDGASDPTVINPITDVSARVQVTQNGFGRNRATGLWAATMTLQNTGTTVISGPIQVVLTNLTAGVTMTNNVGMRNGIPYITVLPAGQTLGVGGSVSVIIQFSNPGNALINFTPVTVFGAF